MSQKYLRSFHFPWSPGATSDDKIMSSTAGLIGVPIIITCKLDGSNCCLENKDCFARTHSGPPKHESFDMFKALHAQIKHLIPYDIQIFCENLYARHSIYYDRLPSYVFAFNVRDLTTKTWVSWDEVELWAEDLSIPTVPVLFRGSVSSEKELKELTEELANQKSCYGEQREGVVVRITNEFDDDKFPACLGKFVRKWHVQTSTHWAHATVVKNGLITS